MAFSDKFNEIKSILKNEYDINISNLDYDGFIVKRMSESNCLIKDISSKQTHIAITGDQMELFPYIYSKQYIEKKNANMKNYFVIKAIVNIFKSNCEAIENGYIDFENKDTLKEEMCIYPRSGGDQVQLSMKRDGDSYNFIKFRELIKPNNYLVLAKKKRAIEYDAFIIEQKFISSKDYDSIIELERDNVKDINFIRENSIEHFTNIDNTKIDKPHQRIFFGAPGTGKSYELNREAKKYFGENYSRVTFHPNYMYGNFVGVFKPFPKILKNANGEIKKDEDGNIQESITYEYVTGVLMNQLINAFKNPSINYLLLIEEINRANVSAVFGDIFQLLDRNEIGESEYVINTSKELQEALKKEFNGEKVDENIKMKIGDDFRKIFLPRNFYIWATMNSADQGVMPMDTAFRRRWEFKYLGINDAANRNNEDFEKYRFKINSTETVNWDKFRRELNKKLSALNIPEDKLIGPYFVSKSILEDGDLNKLTETIKNKVLMYLYEDAAKAFRSSLFAENKYSTYSTVCKYFDENALHLFKGNLEVETEDIDKIELNLQEEENNSIE